jgi:hypothetical protein
MLTHDLHHYHDLVLLVYIFTQYFSYFITLYEQPTDLISYYNST